MKKTDIYINYNPQKEKLKIYLKPLLPIYRKAKYVILSMTYKKHNTQLLKNKMDIKISWKDAYKGKCCFIIGNGPSLNCNDLDKLKSEICFGTNAIYELFDKTEWRPSFYCVWDQRFLLQYIDKISELVNLNKIIGIHEISKNPIINDAAYLRIESEDFYPSLPSFSSDITKCVYEGNSVLYMCMQIAAYMGFSTIYLLGVDHNYSVNLLPDGTIEHNYGVKNHFSGSNDEVSVLPQLNKVTLAFKSAKNYTDLHGIKVYNATRGGKLEVFERVDFDSLFPPEDSENNAPKIDK